MNSHPSNLICRKYLRFIIYLSGFAYKNVTHHISPCHPASQPLTGDQRTACKYGTVGRTMLQQYPLPFPQEPDFVLADDVAAAHTRIVDLVRGHPATCGSRGAQCECSAGRRIALTAVM